MGKEEKKVIYQPIHYVQCVHLLKQVNDQDKSH